MDPNAVCDMPSLTSCAWQNYSNSFSSDLSNRVVTSLDELCVAPGYFAQLDHFFRELQKSPRLGGLESKSLSEVRGEQENGVLFGIVPVEVDVATKIVDGEEHAIALGPASLEADLERLCERR